MAIQLQNMRQNLLPGSNRFYCDFVFEIAGEKNWVELKAICTLYRSRKPTSESLELGPTRFARLSLDRVRADIDRLAGGSISGSKWSLIFMYPASENSDSQLRSMAKDFGYRIEEIHAEPLTGNDTSLNIYLLKVA